MDELTSKPPSINPSYNPEGRGSASQTTTFSGESRDYLRISQDAFRQSTNYIDTNYRLEWENSIRAFNSKHASDSKYNNPAYSKRSTIFRPKTRSIVRKNEAAAAAAFFSNSDVTSIEAVDASNPKELASADVMKALLQYRLKKSIPWFKIVQGAIQDAQVTAACARVEWLFKKVDGKIVDDRPDIELIPIENIRFDAGASWLDPVNSSPYLIHLMPMYVGDVKERMRKVDPKTGAAKWKRLSDSAIKQGTMGGGDTTRQARENGRQDPKENDNKMVSDYETVWVQRHIHRMDGVDMEWYTMGDLAMLTEPKPLSETVLHGKRPYVIGSAIIETHRPLPTSLPQLIAGLQNESNEIANQRMDNVKFVLNKRWFVQRGKNADLASLVRNTPGGVTLVDGDPNVSIKEVNWPDVTASSYQEQDRLNADLDELGGNFSASSAAQNGMAYQTQGKMELLQTPSSMITEYMLRTFTETWVEPVLRMLIKLEQHYETDETILAVASKQAKLQQKYGIDSVTDELMNKDLTLTVNVGMGATNPQQKQQKFANALNMVMGAAQFNQKSPGVINITEVAKEAWAHSGYQDGTRFMNGDDPNTAQMKQQMQQMQQTIQQLQKAMGDKVAIEETKRMKTTTDSQTKVLVEAMRQDNENKRALSSHVADGIHKVFEHHNQYTKTGIKDAKH